eukprot:UN28000
METAGGSIVEKRNHQEHYSIWIKNLETTDPCFWDRYKEKAQLKGCYSVRFMEETDARAAADRFNDAKDDEGRAKSLKKTVEKLLDKKMEMEEYKISSSTSYNKYPANHTRYAKVISICNKIIREEQ